VGLAIYLLPYSKIHGGLKSIVFSNGREKGPRAVKVTANSMNIKGI
jgi:hypothetical protein